MKRPPISPKEGLGIAVGDIVRTDYNTGPYRVAYIRGPKLHDTGILGSIVIWPWPVISLTCVDLDWNMERVPQDHSCYWLNNIHREGDRWFDCHGSEIFVKKTADVPTLQAGLFSVVDDEPQPYPFQDGVDYLREGEIWHCDECGADFNAVPKNGRYKPRHCKEFGIVESIYMMAIDGDTRNDLQRYLRFKRKDTHHGSD